MMALGLTPETRWECPNCTLQEVTHEQRAHTRMHACRGLFGMTVPMVVAGTRCKIELREREDYVGGEVGVRYADGRAIMSAVVTRDDGMDCAVYAPQARAEWD